MGRIGALVSRAVASPEAVELVARLVAAEDCRTGLDVGCGTASHLSALRPRIATVGVDVSVEAIEASRAASAHDHYIKADLLESDVAGFLPPGWGGKADIVTLIGVIEHFPKRRGYDLLERCEAIARKLVVLETPNGFVPQGPEFGNEHMRHLSGWYIADFEGLGYRVGGTSGTRYLRGYAAGLKWPYPGVGTLDVLLSRALRSGTRPRHAFNLFAVKDVRGVPARLGALPT